MNDNTINLPATCTLPAGYRWGAHAGGDRRYIIRESDGAEIQCHERLDLYQDLLTSFIVSRVESSILVTFLIRILLAEDDIAAAVVKAFAWADDKAFTWE